MKEKEKVIEEIKKFRKNYNDTHANSYDKEWWSNKDALNEYKSFNKLVHVQPNDVVLDIATGTGTFLIEMAKLGAICYGIDQSPKMLEHLNHKIKNEDIEENIKEISVGTADSLPYPNNYFDWVTCIGMLEYYPIEYVKIVLSEVVRVLKLDGCSIIDIADPLKKYAQERDWIFSLDLEKFEKLVESIGLRIVTMNSTGYMFQILFSKI